VYVPKGKLTPEARRLMAADVARVHEHGERHEYAEGKALALKVRGGLDLAGVASPHVCWLLAVLCDDLGELEEAFNHITEATALDPLEPGITRSFGIITDRLRRALIDPERDPADESTPRLHGMLVQAGKADELAHIAMARHLAEVGKADEALALLDAVVLLAPGCRDAWVAKSTIAKNLGRHEEAAVARAQASALDGGPVPLFGIPGQAVA
jgi:tetratricopeptide (TPR) repeat protein